jgi:CRP-like cAMP-binding protein
LFLDCDRTRGNVDARLDARSARLLETGFGSSLVVYNDRSDELLRDMSLTDSSLAASAALPDVLTEAFPHSRADTRSALARASVVRRFGAGETIIRQGDESNLSFVLEGRVALRRTTIDGRQLITRIVTRGQLAPILPLAAIPAGSDAVALTPCAVALWNSVEVRSLAFSDSGLAVDLLDAVIGAFDEVVGRLDSLLHQDAVRRVARVLYLRADLFFAEPPLLTRAHLPNLVGTSREMTGRVLRVLESRRLVARAGRDRLRLLDPEGLAKAAECGTNQPRTVRLGRPRTNLIDTVVVKGIGQQVPRGGGASTASTQR